MTGADKVVCGAATLLLLFVLSTAPAKAQVAGFGAGAGGGADMMTQMAPMLEMMKAKMGKRRFAALMQTMGPMMSRMMENGGFAGMGGMPGGLGDTMSGGFGGVPGGGYGGTTPDAPVMSPGYGGGDFMGMIGGAGGADMMTMIPQLMRLANVGGGTGHRHHHRRRD